VAAFLALKERVIARTGHFYYQDKDDLLWDRVLRRMTARGFEDCTAYLALLESRDGEAEWSALEADITIGETFFFRYGEQFAALRTTILPELIERNGGDRRLRIWSAGCATGAEAYSLAIVLRELLGDSFGDWRISILGTDINNRFLETARHGRFGQWALRSLNAEQRAKYFTPGPDNSWLLRPRFRDGVRFERHNLLSLLDGSSPLQFSDFDLILCRNVLIYFHPDTVVGIVGALRDALRDEGWMLLGHAEPNPVFERMMQTVNLPGTVAYRRLPPNDLSAPSPIAEVAPPPLAPLVSPIEPVPHRLKIQPPPVDVPMTAQDNGPDEDCVAVVRDAAGAGKLDEALTHCQRGLQVCPTDADLHYYDGLIQHGLGHPDLAEAAFRKAIYLRKAFAMAHLNLGLLLIATARSAMGQRYIANAAQLTVSLPEDAPVPEGDGLSAGNLRQIVQGALARASGKNRRWASGLERRR
jgi:chemotaxis protein methyltransferase CheR